MRPSRRQPDELRAISLERGVVKYAEGSCFVKFGDTHVLVTATLEDRLPPWLKGQARGWVTAEYGMLPRATSERTRREASAGKPQAVAAARAFSRAFSLKVVPVSAGSGKPSAPADTVSIPNGIRSSRISSSLPGLWVATTRRPATRRNAFLAIADLARASLT